jgi:hypothetical protein
MHVLHFNPFESENVNIPNTLPCYYVTNIDCLKSFNDKTLFLQKRGGGVRKYGNDGNVNYALSSFCETTPPTACKTRQVSRLLYKVSEQKLKVN